MYDVEDSFFTNIAKYGRQIDTEIEIEGQLEPLSIYDINILKHRFNSELFQSVMRVLEVDSNNKIEKDSIINAKLGIKFDEYNYSYLNYKNYKVLKEPEYDEDTRAYVTLAYDKMHEAMIPYDLTPTFPIKVRDLVILICERLSWDTSNIPTSFINSEKLIYADVFSNIDYTFRDVLDEIAKITCSFPCFELDGLFTLKYITETGKIIDNQYLSEDNLEFIREYSVNSVVFARAEDSDTFYKKDDEDIEVNGLHEYKLSDLQILSTDNRSDFMDEIYEYLRNLKFWIFDIETTGVFIFDIADRFTIKTDINSYSVVLLNSEGTIEQGLSEQMYTDEPRATETDYQYSTSDKKQDNLLKLQLDKQNKKITALASEVTDNSTKITEVTETVEGLNATVQEIEVLTNEISGVKTISLGNCVKGSLLELHIYGNNTVFEYLYPSDDLYPADDLYPYGDSRIKVTNENGENKIYELGVSEVLRQNAEIKDEYILAEGKAKIIRRVNEDGSIKETEIIEELGEYSIELSEGSNVIEIVNYTANIQAKFAIKSSFTDVFATRVEMNAEMKFTAEEFNVKLSKKVGEDEVISKINQSAEAVGINAKKIELTADDILNLLSGGTINLSGKNITMSSTHLRIGSDGKMRLIADDNSTDIFRVESNESKAFSYQQPGGAGYVGTTGRVDIQSQRGDGDYSFVEVQDTNGRSEVRGDGITTPLLTQTSLKKFKKNIEKSNDMLEIVKNSDIYSYNLKTEQDNAKKHFGFVIGDAYRTPEEVVSKKGDGIDPYSMCSILWKAVQELIQEIELLKEDKNG